jgi:hypothetical protein
VGIPPPRVLLLSDCAPRVLASAFTLDTLFWSPLRSLTSVLGHGDTSLPLGARSLSHGENFARIPFFRFVHETLGKEKAPQHPGATQTHCTPGSHRARPETAASNPRSQLRFRLVMNAFSPGVDCARARRVRKPQRGAARLPEFDSLPVKFLGASLPVNLVACRSSFWEPADCRLNGQRNQAAGRE